MVVDDAVGKLRLWRLAREEPLFHLSERRFPQDGPGLGSRGHLRQILASRFLDGIRLSLNRGRRPPACWGPLPQKAVAACIVNARLSVAGTFRPAWGLGESSELTQDLATHMGVTYMAARAQS